MNIKYLMRKEKLCLIFRVIPAGKIVQAGSFMAIAIVFVRGAESMALWASRLTHVFPHNLVRTVV